jgi:hypothetical protein
MGLLDGITIMTAIKEREGCSWEEARKLWQESNREDNVVYVDFVRCADEIAATGET